MTQQEKNLIQYHSVRDFLVRVGLRDFVVQTELMYQDSKKNQTSPNIRTHGGYLKELMAFLALMSVIDGAPTHRWDVWWEGLIEEDYDKPFLCALRKNKN